MKNVYKTVKNRIGLWMIMLMMPLMSGCVSRDFFGGPPTDLSPPSFDGITGTLMETESLEQNATTEVVKGTSFYKSLEWLAVVYKYVVYGTIVYLMISFVLMAVSLARYGSNPQKREEIIGGFVRNLTAIAIIGGAASVVGLFWHAFS